MTARPPLGAITSVGIIVPAHNEQDFLPFCLGALDRATARLRDWRDIAVMTVVVLDRCVDRSASAVAAFDASTLAVDAGNVGVARATGCAEVLRRHAPRSPASLWLASTDADSRVPEDWLTRQIELAEAGAEVVLGTVTVDDWSDHPARSASLWAATYEAADGHPHVHGANVGCRADAYLATGGFLSLSCDEDVALAAALADRVIMRVGDIAVTTSARLTSRTTGGFATFLSQLG